ncbi:hypothetical protein [Herbiconiux sp.]|uniref:hypothetical protein n=1 Tax=Herbiconiux sp. TaxID=1871186 RepID=UPI0025BDDC87|nr:hypothetical protein [Herbiconiux sp.]
MVHVAIQRRSSHTRASPGRWGPQIEDADGNYENGGSYRAAPGIVTATISTPGGASRGGIVIDVQPV